jgi:Tol biopolymer transport system component
MKELTLRRTLISILMAILVALSASADELADRFRSDVEALASDSMEGRGLGTEGLERAADWIETRLRAGGLKPAFGTSYRQPFQVKTGVELGEGNSFRGIAPTDWVPLGFSSAGKVEGELVFAGYGIEAPAIGYQELDRLDLKGKVVLMLRYEPQERDEGSPFDGRRPSRWSAMRYKVLQARERGAAAVIFTTGPLQDEEKDKLPALRNDGPESPAGIPVIQVKRSVAESWLKGSGIDLLDFQKAVDRDLQPLSKATGLKIDANVALNAKYVKTENVAGIISGKGSLASEVVVVGAHYDHLGLGGERSMRPNDRAVHNGADDNASGTVAVLLAAEQLKRSLANVPSHRTIVVALFSAEEVGLAGSSHFVANPPLPVAKTVAMINLDMVGRLRDDQLVALGSESAPQWNALIETAAKGSSLKITSRGDGYGPSDQTSFYAVQIPVIHLFTGTHEQYHTPDDDAATLNAEGGAKVAQFTASLAGQIARNGERPQYARSTAAPAMEGDSRGYGAYLGTVPDYRAMEATAGGVLLSDVRAGGPADKAGIKGGDRIIEMAGTRIENLYDMTFALQDHKPGDTIEVIVIRAEKPLKLRATLGSRAAAAQPPASPVTPAAQPSAHAAPAPTVPAVQTPPAAPHGGTPEPAKKEDSFYSNRPGEKFIVGAGKPFAPLAGEKHLADIRQLTFGGENAEAYFSPDGTKLIFQATIDGRTCDQQYVLDLASGDTKMVSTGKGRTTCGYFDFPEADRVVYASTAAAGEACPPTPDRSSGYVWPIYDTFELWEAGVDGSQPRRLTNSKGYDAEATWCHRGGKLVFTSTRDGDLDLYEMNEAGDVKRLTSTPGYDGGAFYNADCTEIVWRASRPTGAALEDYNALLAKNLVRPGALEIFLMKSDGTNVRQVTANGAANFCPYFHPDGKRIIYSSNAGASPREFDLWLIAREGGEPERITAAAGFDGFPQFSPDGRYLVWASNRANPQGGDTNLFIARWVE